MDRGSGDADEHELDIADLGQVEPGMIAVEVGQLCLEQAPAGLS